MTAVHELSAQSVTAGIDPTLAYGQQERNLDAERQAAIAVGDVTNACLAEAEKRGVEAIDFLDPHGAVARSGDTAYVVDVMQPGTNGHERTASEHVKSGTSNVAGSLSSGVGVARFYAVPGQHPQDPGRDYVLIRPDGKFVVGTTRNQQGFGDMLTQNNYTVTGPSQPGRPDMFDAVSGRPLLAELDAKKRSQEQHLGRAVQANDVVEARKLAAQRAGLTPFQLSRELPRDSVALQVSADSPVLREYVESDAAVAAKRGMPVAAAAASRVGCVYINPDTGNFLINSGNDVIIGQGDPKRVQTVMALHGGRTIEVSDEVFSPQVIERLRDEQGQRQPGAVKRAATTVVEGARTVRESARRKFDGLAYQRIETLDREEQLALPAGIEATLADEDEVIDGELEVVDAELVETDWDSATGEYGDSTAEPGSRGRLRDAVGGAVERGRTAVRQGAVAVGPKAARVQQHVPRLRAALQTKTARRVIDAATIAMPGGAAIPLAELGLQHALTLTEVIGKAHSEAADQGLDENAAVEKAVADHLESQARKFNGRVGDVIDLARNFRALGRAGEEIDSEALDAAILGAARVVQTLGTKGAVVGAAMEATAALSPAATALINKRRRGEPITSADWRAFAGEAALAVAEGQSRFKFLKIGAGIVRRQIERPGSGTEVEPTGSQA